LTGNDHIKKMPASVVAGTPFELLCAVAAAIR